ncbi:1-phosphofructokinase [Vagococcus elongatus]|uniref:Tagatose-6-phosphate kinase n=1 Tax=Vagococcus elongatus TaxID=180344 RepID=A0A430B4C2_9ENTE|nr:1-phosphofructokinase [Vagococcus elongatus]RSU15184.1 1-phosphofructokinase [Vagococcus elongatus]
MIYTLTLNPSIDYVFTADNVQLGALNHSRHEYALPGGKGINVSRILHRLGSSTVNWGFLGSFTGEFIQDELEKEGIHHDFTVIEGMTRINLKMKGETEETEINGSGPFISEQDTKKLKDKFQQLKQEDLVILSGSIPKCLGQDFYLKLIPLIQQQKASFIIDTSGENLLKALTYQPLLVKPNNDELAEIFQTSFSSSEDILPYGKKLLSLGAQHALVSLGGKGALLFTKEKIYRSNVPDGKLVNSVGAGDSMIAGFTHAFLKSGDVIEAFKLGVACGSATAFSKDLASIDKINEVYQQVVIEEYH